MCADDLEYLYDTRGQSIREMHPTKEAYKIFIPKKSLSKTLI